MTDQEGIEFIKLNKAQELIKELEKSLQDAQCIKAEWQRKYELECKQTTELKEEIKI